MHPSYCLSRKASISSGCFQWPSLDLIPSLGVGLTPSRVWEQMNVLFSTRATSAFLVRQRKLEVGRGGREERERAEGGREEEWEGGKERKEGEGREGGRGGRGGREGGEGGEGDRKSMDSLYCATIKKT